MTCQHGFGKNNALQILLNLSWEVLLRLLTEVSQQQSEEDLSTLSGRTLQAVPGYSFIATTGADASGAQCR